MASAPSPTIIVGSRKSMCVAFLLSFFFGPLGMLYATVGGGLVMLVLCAMALLFTAGIGLLLTWPMGIVWAMVAAAGHNGRLSFQVRSHASVDALGTATDRPLAERVG